MSREFVVVLSTDQLDTSIAVLETFICQHEGFSRPATKSLVKDCEETVEKMKEIRSKE